MKRIKIFLMMALSSLMFFSCLKSQEDVFEESSSLRLQKLIRAYKDTLAASENGWIMQYYPTPDKSYGGFNYWLKFDNDQTVSVYTNLTIGDGTVKTSLYDIISERGPLLTFNSYNDILHYFTTPSSKLYQGYQSDYEFVIEGYKDGVFTLKGKIYGNTMYLVRLGDKKPGTYLSDVYKGSTMLVNGDFNCTTEEGTAMYFESSGIVSFRYVEGEDTVVVSKPFALTDEGIDLNTAVEFKGHSLRRFRLDYSNGSYVCTDEGQDGIRFEYDHPDTYKKYEDLVGDYYCVCGGLSASAGVIEEYLDSVKCTLSPTEDKKYLIASNLVQVKTSGTGSDELVYEDREIKMKYDPFIGAFAMISQVIDYNSRACILGQTGSGFNMGENYFISYITDGNGHFNADTKYSTVKGFKIFTATDLNFNTNTKITPTSGYWKCLDNLGSFTIVRWTKI